MKKLLRILVADNHGLVRRGPRAPRLATQSAVVSAYPCVPRAWIFNSSRSCVPDCFKKNSQHSLESLIYGTELLERADGCGADKHPDGDAGPVVHGDFLGAPLQKKTYMVCVN